MKSQPTYDDANLVLRLYDQINDLMKNLTD